MLWRPRYAQSIRKCTFNKTTSASTSTLRLQHHKTFFCIAPNDASFDFDCLHSSAFVATRSIPQRSLCVVILMKHRLLTVSIVHAAYLNSSASSGPSAHGTSQLPSAGLGLDMIRSVVSNTTSSTFSSLAAIASLGSSPKPPLGHSDNTASASVLHAADTVAHISSSASALDLRQSTTRLKGFEVTTTAHGRPNITGTGYTLRSNLLSTAASQDILSTAGINATGTGCLAALASFASANSSWIAQLSHFTVVNSTVLRSEITGSSYTTQLGATTLCDGWPRFTGSYTGSFDFMFTTWTSWTTQTVLTSYYPGRKPLCSLASDECMQWWVTHSSCSSSSEYQWMTRKSAVTTVAPSCSPYLVRMRTQSRSIVSH